MADLKNIVMFGDAVAHHMKRNVTAPKNLNLEGLGFESCSLYS